MRIFNFSAGPAVLPEPVLRQAAAEMLDWHGSGVSVMEMSHRGKEFIGIADKALKLKAHHPLGWTRTASPLFPRPIAIKSPR